MSALSLSCRVCATEHPLEAVGTCSRCFGPLDPTYDWDHLRATITREHLAEGPLSIWRYADLLPVSAPSEPRLSPGGRRSSRPRGWRRRSASASSGSSSTPRTRPLVQGPRRGGGGEEGAGARPHDALVLVHGKSRRCRGGARRSEGMDAAVFVPADLEPEKLAAAAAYGPTIYAVDGTTTTARDCRSSSPSTAVGIRQRQPPLVLRRGLEDHRVRARRAARVAGSGRRRDPDRLRRAVPQGRPGLLGAPLARLPRGTHAGPLSAVRRRVRAGRDRVPRGRRGEARAAN